LTQKPRAGNPEDLEWTGERMVPQLEGQIAFEHLHRYAIACGLADGKDVLDIASGEGYGSALLSRTARSVTGVEIDRVAVEHANHKYGGEKLRFLCGSCTAIPVRDSSVDLVVSFETIEHIEGQEKFMEEIVRILRPDGIALISSPDRAEYGRLRAEPNPFHVRELSHEEFEKLLARYFRNFSTAKQRMVAGSAIFLPEESAHGGEKHPVAFWSGDVGDVKQLAGIPGGLYSLAICSNAALPALPVGVFENQRESAKFWDTVESHREHLERVLSHERERTAEAQATLLAIKKTPQFRLGLAVGKIGSSLKRPFESLYRLFCKPHRLRIKGGLGIFHGVNGVSTLEGIFRSRGNDHPVALTVRAGGRNWDCTVEPAHPPEKMQILKEYRFTCAFAAGKGIQLLRVMQVRPQMHTKQVVASSIVWQNHPQWLSSTFRSRDENRLGFRETESPLFSIIMPVRDQLPRALRCLAKIPATTSSVNYEIIIGNESPDRRYADVLHAIPGVRVAGTGSDAGFVANCNGAAKSARGKYLLFLSCDAPVSNEWLSSLADLFKRIPAATAIEWKRFSDPAPPAPANYPTNISLMIDRAIFEDLGGFDPHYEQDNFETTDFAFRIGCKGRIYCVEGSPGGWRPIGLPAPNEHGLAFQANEKPVVSIVVPVHNQLGYTLRCLRSVLAHTTDVSYEVIIGNDRSDGAILDILNSVPGIRITSNTGATGFVSNCNQAAKLARGKYILFLNNDTEPRPGWLSSLIEIFDRFPDTGAVGSKLIYADNSLQEAGGIIWNDATGWNFGKHDSEDKPEYNYVKEVDFCSGASLLVDRALFEKLGAFSPEFEPAYYEDVDLAFKIRAAGRKVYYQPKSVVVHHEGKSCGTDITSGMKASQAVNQEKFRSKWAAELQSHEPGGGSVLRARERSKGKKLAVFIDHYVPMIDQDAGSRSTFHYVKLFVDLGMSVKFVGDNFFPHKPYTGMLEQLGVEVLYGDWYRKNIHKWLRDNADQIDVIFAIRSHVTFKYLETFRQLKNARILYYGIDIASIRLQREAELTGSEQARAEGLEEEKLEMTIWQNVDAVYYPSTEEAIYVHGKLPNISSRAIPLNICESFREDYPGTLESRKDLVFVGGFQHPPNADGILWFLDECWPEIAKEIPGCKFYIVGSKPPEAVRQRLNDRVMVTGWLSDDDLTALYQTARLVVAPLRYGGGVKGKVVEAIRHHIPPVITPMAAEGLPGIESCTCVREAKAGEFSEAVISLYRDEEKLRELSGKCAPYIQQNFSPEVATAIIANDLPWLKDAKTSRSN